MGPPRVFQGQAPTWMELGVPDENLPTPQESGHQKCPKTNTSGFSLLGTRMSSDIHFLNSGWSRQQAGVTWIVSFNPHYNPVGEALWPPQFTHGTHSCDTEGRSSIPPVGQLGFEPRQVAASDGLPPPPTRSLKSEGPGGAQRGHQAPLRTEKRNAPFLSPHVPVPLRGNPTRTLTQLADHGAGGRLGH